MPKELGLNVVNEIKIFDKMSQSEITFYYRKPKSSEYIQYQSSIIHNIVNKKNVEDAQKIQIEWVLKFLIGFKKGSFVINGKEIASDKSDPDYYEEWKELLKEEEAPLLLTIAKEIIGEPNYVIKENPLFFTGS